MPGRISTTAVVLAAAGAATTWAAVKGVGLASGFRSLLTGHTLPAGEDLIVSGAGQTVEGVANGIVGSGAYSNSPVASTASQYLNAGHVYRWGGGNPNGWDCSGFCNWVIGHDLGWPIPGYSNGFDGKAHGPVTGQWALWSGAFTVPRDQAQAGDLAIWPAFHMGIVTTATQMVACPGPNGTPAPVVSRIDGAASGPLLIRRILHGGVPASRGPN